ncbi:MAG: hypothetical protein U0165_01475 [Polyangiaceae bacterium]
MADDNNEGGSGQPSGPVSGGGVRKPLASKPLVRRPKAAAAAGDASAASAAPAAEAAAAPAEAAAPAAAPAAEAPAAAAVDPVAAPAAMAAGSAAVAPGASGADKAKALASQVAAKAAAAPKQFMIGGVVAFVGFVGLGGLYMAKSDPGAAASAVMARASARQPQKRWVARQRGRASMRRRSGQPVGDRLVVRRSRRARSRDERGPRGHRVLV